MSEECQDQVYNRFNALYDRPEAAKLIQQRLALTLKMTRTLSDPHLLEKNH